MNEYQIKAYAKINLALDVTGRRQDGYHLVRMVMQSIGLWDGLTIQKAGSGITVTADTEELPLNQDNLIYKAAELMIAKYGIRSGIRVHLQKNIPIAAGLAGGSTDAAAVMKGINRLFGIGAPLPQLMEYGLSIGADVPYCLMGGTALAEGIGERLTPLPPLPECRILVAKPDIMVSTKYVYEQLDEAADTGVRRNGTADGGRRLGGTADGGRRLDGTADGGRRLDGTADAAPRPRTASSPDIDGMLSALSAGNLPAVFPCMGNVLEAVTAGAYPVIGRIKGRMLALGAAGSLMSGSGPSVYGIFPMEKAREAQEALEIFRQESLAKQVFLVAGSAP